MREFPPQWMSIAAKYSTPFDDAALCPGIVFPSAGPASVHSVAPMLALPAACRTLRRKACRALPFRSLKALNQHARIK